MSPKTHCLSREAPNFPRKKKKKNEKKKKKSMELHYTSKSHSLVVGVPLVKAMNGHTVFVHLEISTDRFRRFFNHESLVQSLEPEKALKGHMVVMANNIDSRVQSLQQGEGVEGDRKSWRVVLAHLSGL